MASTKNFGDYGELIAADLLEDRGYKIIAKNFRSKFGELDIIADDHGALVFVEVKTRWSRKFGSPEEAVTPNKLTRIRRTIDYYCRKTNSFDKDLRIEVVAITMEEGSFKSAKIIKVD